MEKYFEVALNRAQEKFWNSIAESFPDVVSGDISPNDLIAFERITKETVKSWINNNL